MVPTPMAWLRAIAVSLSVLAVTHVTAIPLKARAVLPPASDPFYIPPSGYASEAPGTILRSRTIDASFFGLVPNPVEGYQLLFRTNAINGTAIAGVTTIFRPVGAAPDRFVSFQTAYDSSASICDPSYTYQLGAPQEDLITSVEELILEAFLISGYIVSSPDYEGPDAAFSPGHLEGMVVLDSMRAVENFASTLDLSTSKPAVVGYGYSGGAIATGWAASLQSTYASSLDIKGWASGGTPANLTGTLVYLDGALFSGFLPPAIDGLLKPSAYQAELEGLLDSLITPAGRSKLDFANENCAQADIFNFVEQSLVSTEYETAGMSLLYDYPIVEAVLAQCMMGINASETPTAPVYLFHALQDEIIPYENATTLYANWCAHGAPSVQFLTFGNGGHITTEALGVPGSLQYVADAFAGIVPDGCSMSTTLNSTLDPIALGVELEPVLVALVEALTAAGVKDENVIANLSTLRTTIKT